MNQFQRIFALWVKRAAFFAGFVAAAQKKWGLTNINLLSLSSHSFFPYLLYLQIDLSGRKRIIKFWKFKSLDCLPQDSDVQNYTFAHVIELCKSHEVCHGWKLRSSVPLVEILKLTWNQQLGNKIQARRRVWSCKCCRHCAQQRRSRSFVAFADIDREICR